MSQPQFPNTPDGSTPPPPGPQRPAGQYPPAPPSPGPAQQPYPGPYGGYGTPAPAWQPEPPAAKSGVLGGIGLLLVIACAVALVAAAWLLGADFGAFLIQIGADPTHINSDEVMNDPRFQAFATAVGAKWIVLQAAIWVGFLAWIACIVATATKRGRAAGIVGIILGVLAPLVGFISFLVGMWPALVSLSS